MGKQSLCPFDFEFKIENQRIDRRSDHGGGKEYMPQERTSPSWCDQYYQGCGGGVEVDDVVWRKLDWFSTLPSHHERIF